jgi:hypothetical protein
MFDEYIIIIFHVSNKINHVQFLIFLRELTSLIVLHSFQYIIFMNKFDNIFGFFYKFLLNRSHDLLPHFRSPFYNI